MSIADLLTAAEVRRGPVWTSGDSVWARVRRIGETTCHWANMDWQDANDWELSGYQALHKFSLEILSTHSDSEMYAYEDQYVSHTDPSQPWDSSDGYDDYDPIGDDSDNYPDDLGCYGFLQYDSHNGVWWIQSHIQGTVGSVWIDTDWETPVYWVSRVDKHWDAIKGSWALYDAGVLYHGDDLIKMVNTCLEMI